MAVTPEEQERELELELEPLEGIMRSGEAPLPAVFHNDGDPSSQPQLHDDLALDYISRMLMEEDIVDKFLYQYPDHPALLQAEQPFAQIISDTTTASAQSTTSSDALADRDGGPPGVRITGIDTPQPGFRPAERTEQTGRRLSRCARQFGVPFEFRAIPAKAEAVCAEDLDIDPDEVLVVNSFFHFRTLMDESVIVDRPNPRDLVLSTIRKMKPAVFVHAIGNGSYSSPFFVPRFREALYNFTAQFDMMDATVPRDNDRRLLVERDIFAPSAMNIIACEGADRVERPQNYRQWQARSRRAGLRQLPLDPDIVRMLRETVKQQYHKNFTIDEDHRWLLQGWKGRVLYALSTWTGADDDAGGSGLA